MKKTTSKRLPIRNLNRILRLSVELDETDNLFSYLEHEIVKYTRVFLDILHTDIEDIEYSQMMLKYLIPLYQKTYQQWKHLRKELYEENKI